MTHARTDDIIRLPLSKLTVDARRWQMRDAAFSESTVAAIVAEGISPAKFDPVPVLRPTKSGGRYVVAGDGHSRIEAIERLAIDGTRGIPASWRRGSQIFIPCRIVTADEAQLLAWTANLSRDNFSPCEEAKVFQAMLGTGKSIDDVAAVAHKSVAYVRKTLPLNCLCRTIRDAIKLNADAGGLEKHVAQVLADKFQQYSIAHAQQQELWHRVLKHADLTASFVRALLDRIGTAVAGSETRDLLFALPANVTAAVADMKDRANDLRRAERGLAWLLQCKGSGVLDAFPQFKSLLDEAGPSMLATIKLQTTADADVIGQLCLSA